LVNNINAQLFFKENNDYRKSRVNEIHNYKGLNMFGIFEFGQDFTHAEIINILKFASEEVIAGLSSGKTIVKSGRFT